ncbi:MAG: sensor histidine kinase [Cellulomonadaceae bacterium]|jgi:signal transduction histidine kinase|nr:sensor histidine kinase [Cellulomonadaceae bacterium]
MRRQALGATILAVAVAVILIGVPAVLFAVSYVRYNEEQRLQNRIDHLVVIIETAWEHRIPVIENAIAQAVAGDPMAHVRVRTPDGAEYEGGTPSAGQVVAYTAVTRDGAEVAVSVSAWEIWLRSVQLVVIFAFIAVVALLVGALIAVLAARRFARPIINLAKAAEGLGAGQVQPQIALSGVAEVDLVAAELAAAADRVAARLAAERQFTGDAKHQMRTPLTALSMRLEEIQLISSDPAVQEEARIGLEQVERLVQVVDDLLAASRDMHESSSQLIPLAPIVNQQLEEWKPSYAAKTRRLISQIPADQMVVATAGRLSQVLATLIENSLRHGGGTTTLRARIVSRNRVAIEVLDEGKGIPDANVGLIWERGFTTSPSGTGRGLPLARDLVAADNGMLELEQGKPPVFAVYLSTVLREIPSSAGADSAFSGANSRGAALAGTGASVGAGQR